MSQWGKTPELPIAAKDYASPQKHAPTLVDVAKRAGVSKAAVSAVMSRSHSTVRVSDGTRQRIMEAARELKFQPNVLAQGLNGVRLKSLGISFPTTPHNYIISGHYSSSVLQGILDASYEAGYNMTIFQRPWHDASESAAGFRSQGIDGFLIVAPLAGSDMVAGLSALGIPLVVISTSAEVHNVPSVDVDNVIGVRLLLDHLLSLGHQRIAHLYLDGSQLLEHRLEARVAIDDRLLSDRELGHELGGKKAPALAKSAALKKAAAPARAAASKKAAAPKKAVAPKKAAAPKKAGVKKSAAKKSDVKNTGGKKPGTKKSVAKKVAAKKPAASLAA